MGKLFGQLEDKMAMAMIQFFYQTDTGKLLERWIDGTKIELVTED